MNYVFYGCDTETTGLDPIKNDVIELSLYRLSDNEQKTWLIKPINLNNIDAVALKINGHKLEDLCGETKFGRDTYKDAGSVLVEVENWLTEDNAPTQNRCLIGHNVGFDKNMLEQLWEKCQATDSFPFGRRMIDTMITELFLDYCQDSFAEGYSLKNLSKKYDVKNEKAHSAAADIKCTVDIFRKQAGFFKRALTAQK